MKSSELISLKHDYLNLEANLENIIKENSKAIDEIAGADTLISEAYTIGGNPADDGYISQSINTMKSTLTSFNNVLNQVRNTISALNRKIEIAKDKELAEDTASSGIK